ncbi:hypothetical protein [Streptomyces prasinus]|uniref:Uncharacterized protein n=1 Tax=Streptomyces prasinus TaxID=67345 RepID=A0ABX6B4T1_9ACTN|nr:hypothetical protein [Streptomyces prasinus]QEV08875.1 hypothetical protein CP972_27530 [Streptomyces prasinus]
MQGDDLRGRLEGAALFALDEVTKLQFNRRECGSMSTCGRTAGPTVVTRASDGLTPLIATAN